MSTAQIRQRLHEIIDAAEDKKLQAIYTLLEDEGDEYQLTTEQKQELDRRLEDKTSRTYSWAETLEMAEKAIAESRAKR